MTLTKLRKIRAELERIRSSPHGHKARELEALAKQLGRDRFVRGKEPTWVRKEDPHLSPPLSIPNHSAELKPATCKSIANQILDDCDEWEQFLQ